MHFAVTAKVMVEYLTSETSGQQCSETKQVTCFYVLKSVVYVLLRITVKGIG